VRQSRSIVRRLLPALAAMVAAILAPGGPARAQVSFGSPGAPPYISLEGGAWNALADTHKANSEPDAELRGEYHFGDVWWLISPFLGLSGTSQGEFYGYFGFGIDIDLGPHLVLTPNAAAGYWARGDGLNLGSWWEFRTGAELDWRFPNMTRLGVAFQHMSNAGLTKQNPGEESATLVYSVPLH
jgi:lipid A 3-O-deacylase